MIGKFSHLEVPARDLQEAKHFFSTLFNWQNNFIEWSPEYFLVTSPNGEKNGPSLGLYKSDEFVMATKIVIEVENIEETLKVIKKEGGKILKEKFLISKEVGYAAYFTDLSGNQWGLFSPYNE